LPIQKDKNWNIIKNIIWNIQRKFRAIQRVRTRDLNLSSQWKLFRGSQRAGKPQPAVVFLTRRNWSQARSAAALQTTLPAQSGRRRTVQFTAAMSFW